jgi:hypothetical protein
VGALRFQGREILQGLADIGKFLLHSRENQATIAVIIQADTMYWPRMASAASTRSSFS